ncbi:hypothetical protein B0J13DRAFT_679460 [Dactylonectria estremocensis]|uniref:Uncharacterized protein n=1 Tax=Dactylonectria estremocensis TaxID=1079267 RepID=A0A9P9E0V6_9HYPO|nr:hypothetical protein B0J13DRAFT_679460 [Dactylonectria estremocensis]
MWIHPLYPILYFHTLRSIIETCGGLQVAGTIESSQYPEQNTDMTIFYLVMALAPTTNALDDSDDEHHAAPAPAPAPAPAAEYGGYNSAPSDQYNDPIWAAALPDMPVV